MRLSSSQNLGFLSFLLVGSFFNLAEDVEICEKIFDVKLKIEELWGVPPSCQRLVNDACNMNGNMDRKSGVFFWGGTEYFYVTCNVLDILRFSW